MLDFYNDEFGRLQWCEADFDVDDATIAIRLSCGFAIAFDVKCFIRRAALKGTLTEETIHERAEVEANFCPQRLIVRLEDDHSMCGVDGGSL